MTFSLLSNIREVVVELLLLEDDGVTTLFDASVFVERISCSASDMMQSNQCEVTIANPGAYFDKYTGSTLVQEGRKMSFRKGYVDQTTRDITWFPQFFGKISSVTPTYARDSMDEISFVAFDAMKGLLKQKSTTPLWSNTQYNLIAEDIASQFAGITNFDLYPLQFPAAGESSRVQFLDMTCADMLKTLFDVPLYFAWFNYSGALATKPRLGSKNSSAPGFIGYPDATVAPGQVDFTVPCNSFAPIDTGKILGDGEGFTLEASGEGTWSSGGNKSYPEGRYQIPPGSGIYPSTSTYDPSLCDPGPATGGIAVSLRPQSLALIVWPDGAGPPTLPFSSTYAIQGDRKLIVPNGDSRLYPGGGRLWAMYNDGPVPGGFTDNSGSFTCSVYATPDFEMLDDSLVSTISPEWQDYEFDNQVRVIGVSIGQNIVLGPMQLLANLNDPQNLGFMAPREGKTNRLYFSNQGGTSSTVTANNVYIKIYSPSLSNFGGLGFKFESFLSLTTLDGYSISNGPHEDPGGLSSGNDWPSIKIIKGDGRQEGGVTMKPPTPQYVDVTVYANSDGGGFDYAIEVYGEPILTTDINLTTYVDYNSQTIVGEILSDLFGDHQTYQTSKAPIAMGTPVEVFLDGVSQGIVTADGVNISAAYKVDWERGRVVMSALTYREFSTDSYSTGGTQVSNANTINTTFAIQPGPTSLYNSYRRCGTHGGSSNTQFSYLFSGLQVGRGYTLRLHFSEPSKTASGQRIFDISVNGGVVNTLDIYAASGGQNRAYVYELSGAVADIHGDMLVEFISDFSKAQPDEPLCCGIEVVYGQGQGGPVYSVNCGGAAIVPVSVPVVTADFGYSQNQQSYTIQNVEINNPLLQTLEQTQATGQYYLNYSAWQRNRISITCASIPTLEPAGMMKFFTRKYGANGSDLWMYIKTIKREVTRSGSSEGYDDQDTYDGYLLFKRSR